MKLAAAPFCFSLLIWWSSGWQSSSSLSILAAEVADAGASTTTTAITFEGAHHQEYENDEKEENDNEDEDRFLMNAKQQASLEEHQKLAQDLNSGAQKLAKEVVYYLGKYGDLFVESMEIHRFAVKRAFGYMEKKYREVSNESCSSNNDGGCDHYIAEIKKAAKKLNGTNIFVRDLLIALYKEFEKWLKDKKDDLNEMKKDLTSLKKRLNLKMNDKSLSKIKPQLRQLRKSVNKNHNDLSEIEKDVHFQLLKVQVATYEKICLDLEGYNMHEITSKHDKYDYNKVMEKSIELVYAAEEEPVIVLHAQLNKQQIKPLGRRGIRSLMRRNNSNNNDGGENDDRELSSNRSILKTGSVVRWLCNCEVEHIFTDAIRRLEQGDEEYYDDPKNYRGLMLTSDQLSDFSQAMQAQLIDLFPGLQEVRLVSCAGFY
eukprot:CAMPEP_0118699294 /NCGR_PEP_ID=MMETSP0800-20121206/15801_1 /TAXON_ID=210618 ORGANISM="Striatella unipunctata, Strain CCMP2910" /NCGR_SAMPLE_ID=MMETSP0800 /ASSEMBLY_ACC=CAM_ASM_000638 /LENGTH=428 /DNA_ID=CAMNT_0006599459 /DNA_START=66 /DNA_END=1352 /DNA_ORIENTATION=-